LKARAANFFESKREAQTIIMQKRNMRHAISKEKQDVILEKQRLVRQVIEEKLKAK
jgi:hypothetical protein